MTDLERAAQEVEADMDFWTRNADPQDVLRRCVARIRALAPAQPEGWVSLLRECREEISNTKYAPLGEGVSQHGEDGDPTYCPRCKLVLRIDALLTQAGEEVRTAPSQEGHAHGPAPSPPSPAPPRDETKDTAAQGPDTARIRNVDDAADGNRPVHSEREFAATFACANPAPAVPRDTLPEEPNTDCPLCGSAKTMLMAHCRDCGGEWAGGQMLSHNACVSAKATAARLQAELEEARADAGRYRWIANNFDAFQRILVDYPSGFEIEVEIDAKIAALAPRET